MLIPEFLEKSAQRFPDKVALVFRGRRFVYSQVDSAANRLANALLKSGLDSQERAAVYMEPSPEAVISIFGILKAAGVFLVINPQIKAKKLEYILNDCQVRVLITDGRRLREVAEILPGCPQLNSIIVCGEHPPASQEMERIGVKTDSFAEIQLGFPESRPACRSIDIDLASLVYTSGSTGIPKGVMLTHLIMVSAARSITEYLENTPDDIIIDVLPLSFDYGLYQVLMAFYFGGTVVLESSFLYLYEIVDLIIREKVTGFPIVPTIAALLFKLKNLEQHDFSSLRYITNTAQAIPPRYIERLRQIFPRAKFYSMYGLTECKRVSYLPPEDLDRRPTSVGKAMPNTEVYLINEDGSRIEKSGQVGELVVRGANVMAGYWNLPDETARVLKPGRIPGERVLHTGDLFRTDQDGFLYFVSRKDDMLKVSGERVSPKEIENCLCELEGIIETAVIGVPDEIFGQAIKVFAVANDEARLDSEAIIRHCKQNLEPFMVPKYVELRKSLPKSASGKINKKKLK